MVRDRQSYNVAKQHFDCPVTLVPDCAFFLGPLPRANVRRVETLFVMRTDIERAPVDLTELFTAMKGSPVVDWLDEPRRLYDCLKPIAALRAVLAGGLYKMDRREVLYAMAATHRLNRGIHLLSRGTRVVTDRLHVHIMCVLLGIPHVALDNSYGKIHGYIDAWERDCCLVQTATTSRQAINSLIELKAP
jgi:pyruvyl transferase EpsO